MPHNRKEDRPFSGTEVGALIESFRGDISVIAEDVRTLRVDVGILKEDVRDIKIRLTGVEDVLRISIPQTNSRLAVLESKAV